MTKSLYKHRIEWNHSQPACGYPKRKILIKYHFTDKELMYWLEEVRSLHSKLLQLHYRALYARPVAREAIRRMANPFIERLSKRYELLLRYGDYAINENLFKEIEVIKNLWQVLYEQSVKEGTMV